MAKIKNIIGREILDSNGFPTVEVDMILDDGNMARASVPSGTSTGAREALELRDKDDRYDGKGVLKAVENINTIIRKKLIGMELNQIRIDDTLIALDGTKDKSKLGANAMLAVSLASIKCLAMAEGKEVYEYVSRKNVMLPIPMMNLINGGAHGDNNIDIQEFMVVPVVKTFKERLRAGAEVFHALKKLLIEMKCSTNVGKEGGFAPKLGNNESAIALITRAITKAGYELGKDIFIALDVAASEMYDKETDTYTLDKQQITVDQLITYYEYLVNKYKIISIEDPFREDDFDSFAKLTKLLGNRIMVVGDDLFVTNEIYLKKGIEMGACNAILLKANQIGTITEMTKTLILAKKNNLKTILSHRSGETEDTFIADLSVGLNIPYIKTGGLSRGERIAKYNQLLRIEEQLVRKN